MWLLNEKRKEGEEIQITQIEFKAKDLLYISKFFFIYKIDRMAKIIHTI